MSDRAKPSIVQMDMTPEMVEEVMNDFCRENPGRTTEAMDGKEFADRLMAKMLASAQKIEGGNA